MNSRKRVKYALNHKESDLVPIHDSPWESTIKRWKLEGMPKDTTANDYFNYDMAYIWPDYSPQYQIKILHETKDHITAINRFGEKIRSFKDNSATIEVINSPVKNKKDWDLLKERYTVNSSRLISFNNILDVSPDNTIPWDRTLKNFNYNYEKGIFIVFLVNTGFDMIQRYLGMEKLLIAFIDSPEWVKEMFMEHAKFIIKLFEFLVSNGLKFDGVFLGSDMGYKNATFFSPRCYKELLLPSDKLLCSYFNDIGLPVILHTDGNVEELIPFIIEAGFNCLQPIEVKSGMDLIKLKNDFGEHLSLMGGIDVRLFNSGNYKIIEEEIMSKFKIAKKGGGYIYHSDHSVPDNISFLQYQKVMDIVSKYRKY